MPQVTVGVIQLKTSKAFNSYVSWAKLSTKDEKHDTLVPCIVKVTFILHTMNLVVRSNWKNHGSKLLHRMQDALYNILKSLTSGVDP